MTINRDWLLWGWHWLISLLTVTPREPWARWGLSALRGPVLCWQLMITLPGKYWWSQSTLMPTRRWPSWWEGDGGFTYCRQWRELLARSSVWPRWRPHNCSWPCLRVLPAGWGDCRSCWWWSLTQSWGPGALRSSARTRRLHWVCPGEDDSAALPVFPPQCWCGRAGSRNLYVDLKQIKFMKFFHFMIF